MTAQIVEKNGEGLSRVYDVTIPANDLAQKLEAKIAEIAPTIQLKGFRPGKVPAAQVRRMYGKSLMNDIVQETLASTNEKLLNDNNLRAAGTPQVNSASDYEQVLTGKIDLTYEFAVEVMPEIKLMDPTKIKLEKLVYAPADKDIEETITEVASMNRAYESRTGKSVKAKKDDQVIIDFVGRMDGETFEGGSAEDAPLVLGSGQFIPGFEDQLIGVKAGDELTVKVTFPADYGAERLKGKPAEFEVKVKDVKSPTDRAIDDELAKSLGMENLDKLKEAIRNNLTGQYEETSKFKLKRALLDVLDSSHSFDLPPRMVEGEFEGIWNQVLEDEAREGRSDEDKGKTEDQLKGEYRKIAERRVRLGLVLAEFGREKGVTVNDQELSQALQREAMNMARQYNMEPQQVFDLLVKDQNYMTQARAPIFEQKVVELLFGLASVKDKKVSKAELMKDDELPEGYGA